MSEQYATTTSPLLTAIEWEAVARRNVGKAEKVAKLLAKIAEISGFPVALTAPKLDPDLLRE